MAQPGTVLGHQKISDTEGNFTGVLDNVDVFGTGMAALGDLDGDGLRNVTDLTLFAAAYGAQLGEWSYDPDADLDSDGSVNAIDFTLFAGYFGTPCP